MCYFVKFEKGAPMRDNKGRQTLCRAGGDFLCAGVQQCSFPGPIRALTSDDGRKKAAPARQEPGLSRSKQRLY
jgi:hypothetical protein